MWKTCLCFGNWMNPWTDKFMTWKVMIGQQERVELHKAMVMKMATIVSVQKLNKWRDEDNGWYARQRYNNRACLSPAMWWLEKTNDWANRIDSCVIKRGNLVANVVILCWRRWSSHRRPIGASHLKRIEKRNLVHGFYPYWSSLVTTELGHRS